MKRKTRNTNGRRGSSDSDPGWIDRARRQEQSILRAQAERLHQNLKALKVAYERTVDPRRKYVLSNDIIRTRKQVRDLNQKLAGLKKRPFRKQVEAVDKFFEEKNAKRSAITFVSGKPMQGGSPA